MFIVCTTKYAYMDNFQQQNVANSLTFSDLQYKMTVFSHELFSQNKFSLSSTLLHNKPSITNQIFIMFDEW